MIRGKGASKEGKFRGIPQPGEDEELHALVSASSPDELKKAVDKVTALCSHDNQVYSIHIS